MSLGRQSRPSQKHISILDDFGRFLTLDEGHLLCCLPPKDEEICIDLLVSKGWRRDLKQKLYSKASMLCSTCAQQHPLWLKTRLTKSCQEEHFQTPDLVAMNSARAFKKIKSRSTAESLGKSRLTLYRFGTNSNRGVATYWQKSQAKDEVIRCSGLLFVKELCYPLQMRCNLGRAEFLATLVLQTTN